jgi:DNA modification methylase
MRCTIHEGDVLAGLANIESGTVQTCVTSPPYWGLRDYGVEGQIGLESTPDAFVQKMVDVFREVRRVLRDDGTLWLNIGDSYASDTKGSGGPDSSSTLVGTKAQQNGQRMKAVKVHHGLKSKDLCMIPWRVALALQSDGWWLRSVIVWAKKSPMPESVTDRPTSSWEPIFLLAKSERYYYDAEAVKEPLQQSSIARLSQDIDSQEGSHRAHAGAKTNGTMKAVGGRMPPIGGVKHAGSNGNPTYSGDRPEWPTGRNQRNVWHLGPEPYAEAHFATFPTEIPRRCILAGSKPGDTVLDPFLGSGTTLAVAVQLDRRGVGCELNPEYIQLAKDRIGKAAKPNTYASPRAKQETGGLFKC